MLLAVTMKDLPCACPLTLFISGTDLLLSVYSPATDFPFSPKIRAKETKQEKQEGFRREQESPEPSRSFRKCQRGWLRKGWYFVFLVVQQSSLMLDKERLCKLTPDLEE